MAKKAATRCTGNVRKPSDAQLDAENDATKVDPNATPLLNADADETLALATKCTGNVPRPSDAQHDAENDATKVDPTATPLINPDADGTLALAASEDFDSEDRFQCPTCNQLQPIEDRFVYQKTGTKEFCRCVNCHRLMSRLNRAISRAGPSVKEEWHAITPENKHKFFAENAFKFGNELASVLTETITECRVETNSRSFHQDAEFKDEDEVKKIYEGKPNQLAAVLKNAKRLYCPIRETHLYATPTYLFRSSDETSVSKTEKRQIDQEQTKKPQKQKKQKLDGHDTLSKSELARLAKIRLEMLKIVYATRTPSRPTIITSSFELQIATSSTIHFLSFLLKP